MREHYLPTHEWARRDDGSTAIVFGISAFAAGEVGEIIHVAVPKVGTVVTRGSACAEIESVKSVNDVYAPVDGTIIAINSDLAEHPDLVNSDPLGRGWFAKIAPKHSDPLAGLMPSESYLAQLRG